MALGALAASGCGGEEGVADGAAVSAYVSVPLSGPDAAAGRRVCDRARREAGPVGGVRLRVVCLDDTGGTRHWTLAAVGANARRAAEDSTTVGYVGELDPAATRFSRAILEEAGIAQLPAGPAAMDELVAAVEEAGDSGSLREAVSESLSG